jgi:hypothetical protein
MITFRFEGMWNMAKPLFEPRLPNEEGTDPRVAKLMTVIDEAIAAGVDTTAIAEALPDAVTEPFLLNFRAATYGTPGGLGYDISSQAGIYLTGGRAAVTAVSLAVSVNILIDHIIGQNLQASEVHIRALEFHWAFLRGYVLAEVALGTRETHWLHWLVGYPDDVTQIDRALRRGHSVMTAPFVPRYWPHAQTDGIMGTDAIVDRMHVALTAARQRSRGPYM